MLAPKLPLMSAMRRRRRQLLRKRLSSQCRMQYAGYRLSSPDEALCEVDWSASKLSAEEFFTKFVATRTPCVLRNFAHEGELGVVSQYAGNASGWCEAVRRLAGRARARVEVRSSRRGGRAFGLGAEALVPVSKFIARVAERARQGQPCEWYMTTQPLDTDEEGLPAISSEPCTSLVSHGLVPLRPPILPTLVLANVNIWMGAGHSSHFAANSSGLHHDFHDNLLVCICGEKHLRLWDPSLTPRMRPSGGQPLRVHPNGRIIYASRPNVRADGRDPDADKAAELARRIENASEDDLDDLLNQAVDLEQRRATSYAASECPENFSTLSREKDPRPAVPSRLAHHPSSAIVQLWPTDAIYMPAGWWHEVSSQGGIHAAFNFWFHPPDTPRFLQPYSSSFWQQDWVRRERDDPVVSKCCKQEPTHSA